jgi:hypothetical protein
LAKSTIVLLVHEFTPTPSQSSPRTGGDIDHLDVRHPLEWEVSIFRASLSEPNDRHAHVVHKVLAPQRIFPCGEDARVERQFSFVFRNGDVGA